MKLGEVPAIGILGAGAIGAWVGGRMAAAGSRVVMVGRGPMMEHARSHGLRVSDLDGSEVVLSPEQVGLTDDPADLNRCRIVLCAVKAGGTESAARQLAATGDASPVVVSLQNGIRPAEILAEHLGSARVVPGIVAFNVIRRDQASFHRATGGDILLQDHPASDDLARRLAAAGIEAQRHEDLRPHQWTKLIVNLANPVSALSGAPTRTLMLDPGYRSVVAALAREALAVLRVSGIHPARLRGVPVRLLPTVLDLPTGLVRLLLRGQLTIDPDARSSMWEDLRRGRTTEIEFLNGEIVRLADRHRVGAPWNRRIVELVGEATLRGRGSPELGPEELTRSAEGVAPAAPRHHRR